MGCLWAILLCGFKLPAHAAREAYKYISGEVFVDKRDLSSSFDQYALPVGDDGQTVEDATKMVVAAEL